MAIRRVPFAPGEWYHCYSRGVDKRISFETTRDYQRFMETLYLCNNTESIRRDDLSDIWKKDIFHIPRVETLVDIGAYCIMPNHFHLLLREKNQDGITHFMHKVSTAYTMYFNVKNERVGGLFVKPFRSKHVSDDRYFNHVAQYIHLNPVELFQKGWKQGVIEDFESIEGRLKEYIYSSLPDYEGNDRREKTILDDSALELLRDTLPPLRSSIEEAAKYYTELWPISSSARRRLAESL